MPYYTYGLHLTSLTFLIYCARIAAGQSDSLATSYCDLHNITSGCGCFNKTSALHDIGSHNVQCCCTGPVVRVIPNDFPVTVKVFIFRKMSLVAIDSHEFENYTNVEKAIIWDMYNLERVNADAFSSMKNLQKLSFFNCPKLLTIDGTFQIDNSKFLALTITNTAMQNLPKVRTWRGSLRVPTIDMSHNKIRVIPQRVFEKVELYSLTLSYNRIESIEDFVIAGAKIGLLKLDNNPLYSISENAFANVSTLVQLDLSHSELSYLPQAGLKNVQKLFLNETHNLKRLPSIFVFASLEEAHLTYPYHCCLFKHQVSIQYSKESGEYKGNIDDMRSKYCDTGNAVQPSPVTSPGTTQSSLIFSAFTTTAPFPSYAVIPNFMFRKKRQSKNLPPKSENHWLTMGGVWGDIVSSEKRRKPQTRAQQLSTADDGWGVWGETFDENSDDSSTAPKIMREQAAPPRKPGQTDHGFWLPVAQPTFGNRVVATFCNSTGFAVAANNYSKLKCYPQPDALNPCEDVIGYPWLRAFIWVVWICAILGNLCVIAALCATQQSRVRVNHFLIINLASADLLIGIYLAMLAIMDAHTAGVYYNFAVDWQTGVGCKTAGFLSVFASELSIFTMIVISFEVWYNTKYIFYGKRFQLKSAVFTMCVGYVLSAVTAALPLTNVANGYSATSTCLPLEVNTTIDKLYLVILLIVNLSGFAYIVFNYFSVYCMVAGKCTPTAQTQDMAIAKRMAILIVTDFVCWAPTIFFGLTASAGYPLISITTAKILLVLFYPINAFCNPFLYVFLTKMFRKDMSRFARKHSLLQKLLNRRKKSSLFNSNYLQTFITFASKKHSTPRNSNNSVQNPQLLIDLGGGSASKSNGAQYLYENVRKSDADIDESWINNNGQNVGYNFLRRKSTRKFLPHMSDIIENSNSNSAEDDQQYLGVQFNEKCRYPKSTITLLSPEIMDKLNSKVEVHSANYWYSPVPSPKDGRKNVGADRPDRRASDSSSAGTWSSTRTDPSGSSTITSKMSTDSQRSDCRDLVTYSVKDCNVNFPGKGDRKMLYGSARSLESGYATSALSTPEVQSSKNQTIFRYSSLHNNSNGCSENIAGSKQAESLL